MIGAHPFSRLRTWVLVACPSCGAFDQVPTVFRLKTVMEKYPRRGPVLCPSCEAPAEIAATGRIAEPMRSWINGEV